MDYALLLTSALLGYSNAPWTTIFVVAALLTALSSAKLVALARHYSEIGAVRVFATSASASFVNNLAFTAIAYCLGRGTAGLFGQ